MTEKIVRYIVDNFGAEAEYPFVTSPNTAVFRNGRNGKWFAVLLGRLPARCLGLDEEGVCDVLNLKCDPVMTHAIIDSKRIFRAYHMNKEHWISVRLDSGITHEELGFLVDMSFRLVDRAGRYAKKQPSDI